MTRSWNPAYHPRDKKGRFTRSATRVMSAADKKRGKKALENVRPRTFNDPGEARDYLEGVGPDTPDPAVKKYLDGDWRAVNTALRAGKPAEGVDEIDAAMQPLPDDLMLRRQVPLSLFAHVPMKDLEGMKVRDAAYASTSLDVGPSVGGEGVVTMHILAPAGTNAHVNAADGEILLARDAEQAITRVEPDGNGGWDVYAVVLPKPKPRAKKGQPPTALPAEPVEPKTASRPAEPGASEPKDAVAGPGSPEPDAPKAAEPKPVKPKSVDPGRPAPDVAPARSEPAPPPGAPAGALAAAPVGLHRGDLTGEQQAGLTAYQDGAHDGTSFKTINRALRSRLPGDKGTAAAIAGIDLAMADSALTADVTVHRGVRNARTMFGRRLDGDLTGLRWREDAYVSTSADENAVKEFSRGPGSVEMTITAPKGIGAVDLSDPEDNSEQELLLDRGHEFEVVADHGVVDGVRRLGVLVRPKSAQPEPAQREPAEPSLSWGSALDGQRVFDAAVTIEGAAAKARLARQIRIRDIARVQRAASAYGSDPRGGDLNYVTINAAIRGHGGGIDPAAPEDIKQTVTDLDLLIDHARLPSDTITWRGLQNPAGAIPGWRDDADNTGLDWTAEGYQSTTTDVAVAKEFASGMVPGGIRSSTPTVARILAPKGYPGLKMSPVVSEILMPRNQRFRVVADRGVVDGVRQVDIELVGADG